MIEEGVGLAVAGVDRAYPFGTERLNPRHDGLGKPLERLGVTLGNLRHQGQRRGRGELSRHPSHFDHTGFVIRQELGEVGFEAEPRRSGAERGESEAAPRAQGRSTCSGSEKPGG